MPVAPVEAGLLRSLIDDMPQPRLAAVLARFADAQRRLAEAGLLDPLERPDRVPPAEWRAVGLRYFALGIACPFLEDESCSIHADRPMTCREYLVTTPAEHRAVPSGDTVDCVRVPMKPSTALMRAARPAGTAPPLTPLILAARPADGHPAAPEPRPGPDLVRAFFGPLRPAAPGGGPPVPPAG